MDKFAETISEKIDSITEGIKRFKLPSIHRFIYGVRAQGEAIPEPTFRTTEAENRPAEFDWYQEFRVGSLCGVNQRIHLGQ